MHDTSSHMEWGDAFEKVGKLKESEKVQLGSDQKKETGKRGKKGESWSFLTSNLQEAGRLH